MRPTQPTAGFTLLEILVSLVVLGFLMVALTQGVRFGVTAWDTQARTIARTGDLDAIDRTLRGLIARMDVGVVDEPSGFVGTAGSVSFLTDLPLAAAGLGPRQAAVGLGVDASRRLVLRWTIQPHAERLGRPLAAEQTVLLDGVERLEMGYFQAGAKGGWVSAWSEPDPPALVRLHVVFPRGDPRRWPDIVAAPARARLDE